MNIPMVEGCASLICQFLDPTIDSSEIAKSEESSSREQVVAKGLEPVLGILLKIDR